MINIALIGRHKKTCPLAYPSFTPGTNLTDRENADILIFSNPQDLNDLTVLEALDLANHVKDKKPILLLSEEPYWDLLFNPSPTSQSLTLPAALMGSADCFQINHCNSDVFHFEKLPHFPLTDSIFSVRYARGFKENSILTAKDWEEKSHQFSYGFLGTYRPSSNLGLRNGPLKGLCPARTAHAQSHLEENSLIRGQGWPLQLEKTSDWHRQKIETLSGRCKVINAIENTLAPHYVTEKPFDAYLCGAIPLLWPREDDVYERIGFEPGSYFIYGEENEINWKAYSKTQSHLAELWNGPQKHAEQAALRKRLYVALEKLR